MNEDTNAVRRRTASGTALDAADRSLLSLLTEDATRSYAELGALIHLSPPAVHERVKRLKAIGVIRRVAAVLDGAKVGRPLLSFVQVTTEGWGKNPAFLALSELPEVEEIHSVTGETCMSVVRLVMRSVSRSS